MDQLHYPKDLLFTEEGTFIVAPRHAPECRALGHDARGLPHCPGCRYHDLVDELLALVAEGPTEPVKQKGGKWNGKA